MRTTVDISDELLKKAKVKAIEEGITLKELFTRCLEKELSESQVKNNKMPWKELKGTVNLSNYKPEDSAFYEAFGEDWMPESEFFEQVNEPDKEDSDE